MSQIKSSRKIGPDLLKIAATIFVVVIHHKAFSQDPVFREQFTVFYGALLIISVCIGAFLAYRAHLQSKEMSKSIGAFCIPVGCFLALFFLRRFAVAIFMLVTGYLLTGSLKKRQKPFKEWYTGQNITVRIMRFYLPLIPIFIIGLLYKIFVIDYEYTVLEVIVRFFLGGFKPGSYYVTILAEIVLIFPIIFYVIKRFKSRGLFAIFALHLIYDFLCTFLGMNDVLYKFLVFRFISHIALGVYGNITDFKEDKKINTVLFTVGLLYVVVCVYTGAYNPKMFFQWRDASFFVAIFMYVPVMLFISITRKLTYSDTKLSKMTMTFANSTYHIFLVQLLYYTTIGYKFNADVYNLVITLPVNLLVTITVGIGYYLLASPLEKKITDYVSKKLADKSS